MAKQRIKKSYFDSIPDDYIIGILWRSGTKGILVKTEKGFGVLNNDLLNLEFAEFRHSKSEFVKDNLVKKDLDRVWLFKTRRALLKWFAEK